MAEDRLERPVGERCAPGEPVRAGRGLVGPVADARGGEGAGDGDAGAEVRAGGDLVDAELRELERLDLERELGGAGDDGSLDPFRGHADPAGRARLLALE